MRAVKSFKEDSRAYVRVGRGKSDWFEVNVGLRQGCSTCTLDGVVMEVNARVQGECLVILGEDGGSGR